mgnify:CR=1 FL=1
MTPLNAQTTADSSHRSVPSPTFAMRCMVFLRGSMILAWISQVARRYCIDKLRKMRLEHAASVGAAMGWFNHPFGVRHQSQHIAGIVDDTGNPARRAVDAFGVAESDAALAFDPVYFALSFSFMTEVPFVGFSSIALYFAKKPVTQPWQTDLLQQIKGQFLGVALAARLDAPGDAQDVRRQTILRQPQGRQQLIEPDALCLPTVRRQGHDARFGLRRFLEV